MLFVMTYLLCFQTEMLLVFPIAFNVSVVGGAHLFLS